MEELLKFIWEWIIIGIFVKIIVMKGVANFIVARFGKYTARTDRTDAIWQHYQLRAAGEGHQTDSVLDCHEENCAVFDPA